MKSEIQNSVELNINHLEQKMRQLTTGVLIDLLNTQFSEVNYDQIKADVMPFIADQLHSPLITKQYLRIEVVLF